MTWRSIGAAMLLGLLSFSASAQERPKDDLIAADKAFSALSVAKGSNAAFLSYLADDGRIFATRKEVRIFGKSAAENRFADPKSCNADPKLTILSWVPDVAEVSGTLG